MRAIDDLLPSSAWGLAFLRLLFVQVGGIVWILQVKCSKDCSCVSVADIIEARGRRASNFF